MMALSGEGAPRLLPGRSETRPIRVVLSRSQWSQADRRGEKDTIKKCCAFWRAAVDLTLMACATEILVNIAL